MGNSSSVNNGLGSQNPIEATILLKSLENHTFTTTGPVILEYDACQFKYFLYPLEHMKPFVKYHRQTFYYVINPPVQFFITNVKCENNILFIAAVITDNIPLSSVVNIKQQHYRNSSDGTGPNTANLWYEVSPHHISSSRKLVVSGKNLLTHNLPITFYDYDFFETIKYVNGEFNYGEPVLCKSIIKEENN